MKFEKYIKESFVVIGKEGSTKDGAGFIEELWKNANFNLNEVAHLAKKDDKGNIQCKQAYLTTFQNGELCVTITMFGQKRTKMVNLSLTMF